MLSRRAVLAGGAAAPAMPPLIARAQTAADRQNRVARNRGERQVGLRLRHQPARWGPSASPPTSASLSGSGLRTASIKRASSICTADAALAAGRRAGHLRTAYSAGRQRRLRFPLTFGGTFWMHSHEGLQEQSLWLRRSSSAISATARTSKKSSYCWPISASPRPELELQDEAVDGDGGHGRGRAGLIAGGHEDGSGIAIEDGDGGHGDGSELAAQDGEHGDEK